jgi:membrane protease YdiL (CAAX protease family)
MFTFGGVAFDRKLITLIVFTTIVPMLDHYGHRIPGLSTAETRFVIYFLGSVLVIRLLFRDKLTDYGWRIGHWREGALWVVGVCLIMAVILWFLAQTPSMQRYYAVRTPDSVWLAVYRNGVEMLGWEFIWRGLLLFGMARVLGPGPAIFLQAVPFAFMHLGKPEIETLSTIFGGAGFGFIAWRTQSMVYGWLIHWFIITFTMLVAAGFFAG